MRFGEIAGIWARPGYNRAKPLRSPDRFSSCACNKHAEIEALLVAAKLSGSALRNVPSAPTPAEG